jgi:Ca-activated chloride channel family protein
VVLSDGRDDTPNAPTIGAEQMLTNLGHLHHGTPVLVFTLAYGADADVATLQSISSATGAHYYDATDPTKLRAVLGDLVTSF